MDDADLLTDAAYIIGITHDLAKGTSFFQEYINEKDEKRKKSLKARENTHHGLLSAFFTYAAMKDYLSWSRRSGGLADYLPIISFLAVKRHHGNLSNALDEISEVHAEREKILKTAEEQINSMDLVEIKEILSLLLTGEMSDLKIDVDTINHYILNGVSNDIGRRDKRFIRSLGSKGDLYPYFVTQFLYSALLDADKTDAGLDGVNLKRLDLAEDLVDRYRDAHHFSTNLENINSLRNQIYEEAMESVKS